MPFLAISVANFTQGKSSKNSNRLLFKRSLSICHLKLVLSSGDLLLSNGRTIKRGIIYRPKSWLPLQGVVCNVKVLDYFTWRVEDLIKRVRQIEFRASSSVPVRKLIGIYIINKGHSVFICIFKRDERQHRHQNPGQDRRGKCPEQYCQWVYEPGIRLRIGHKIPMILLCPYMRL